MSDPLALPYDRPGTAVWLTKQRQTRTGSASRPSSQHLFHWPLLCVPALLAPISCKKTVIAGVGYDSVVRPCQVPDERPLRRGQNFLTVWDVVAEPCKCGRLSDFLDSGQSKFAYESHGGCQTDPAPVAHSRLFHPHVDVHRSLFPCSGLLKMPAAAQLRPDHYPTCS